jgi:hypothetical protein
MTRVDDNRDAQRAQQEKVAERIQKEKQRTDKDDFSKLVSQKQENTAKASKQQQVQQGKHLGQQAQAANAKLAARQGIQSHSFQEQLSKKGQENLGNQQLQTQSRTKESKDTRKASTEQTTNETKERIGKEGDKLAAISRDDRQSGRDNKGESGGKEMGQQQQSTLTGQAQAAQPQTQANAAQQVQGPQVPPEIIQQIVERVMVGVNKEGLSEFHIEFKENVLAGSSLRLTAENGKISAHFKTQDVNVARLLKASEGPLARAFARKGMSLEKLEVEGP